jgi:uncharacterized membrane protein YesL
MAKKSFWNAYDHLGGCILLNLLWSLFSLPWLGLALLLVSIGWAQMMAGRLLLGVWVAVVGIQQLMVSPISAALWAVTSRWAHYQGVALREFFPALKKFLARSIGLWLLFTLGALLLALNASFYLSLTGKLAIPGAFASGLMGWAYLFMALVQVYAFPVLVMEDLSIGKNLRRSALVMLDNIWYSLGLLLLVCAILLVGVISVAGLAFLSVSLVGVVTNTGLRQILKKYLPQKESEKPSTWAEIREAQSKRDEEPRGWRDLFKPWEH